VPDERLGSFARASRDNPHSGGDEALESVVRHDNYACCVSNCQLLFRDLLDRVAEYLGVLERDVREQDDLGLDDVGCVEPSPQPGLDDGDVDLSVAELRQRGGGQRLELRRAELLRGRANPRDGPLEGGRITIQPLVPARDVRGCVSPGTEALGPEERRDRARRRRLPVRPDHVNRGIALLRVPEPG
jgi:hypothetical protein